MKNKTIKLVIKYAMYVTGMVLLFVIQSIPNFIMIFGVKPNLVVAAAIAIAVYEDEFLGGLFGALAGLLCDLGGFSIFGFNSIIFLISGVITGLLIIYMLRPTVINYMLLLAGAMLTRGLLDYLLNFFMWGYPGSEKLLYAQILPAVLYTAVAGIPLFWLYGWLHRGFQSHLEE